MNNSERVFQAGEGPWWGLTPKGRRMAKIVVATVVVLIFVAGAVVGAGLMALVLR